MPHVITSLCLRDGGCAVVCPVECIVPGDPADQWPWFYIDQDTCIDCGACVSECPHDAIYTLEDVPEAYAANAGQRLSMPEGTEGFEEPYDGENHEGEPVHLTATRSLKEGEIINLRPAIEINQSFFNDGPGYTVA